MAKKVNANSPNLDALKIQKIQDIHVKCNQFILTGFYSAARGTREFFTASELDQRNIAAKVGLINAGDTNPIIWKSATETICTPISKEQFLQLAFDAGRHVQENIYRFELARNEVFAATTEEGVLGINFEGWVLPE